MDTKWADQRDELQSHHQDGETGRWWIWEHPQLVSETVSQKKKKASSLGRILDYLSPPTCSIHSLCAQWDIPKCYLCRPNRAPTYQRSPVWDEYTFKKKTGRGHMYMFPPTHSRKKIATLYSSFVKICFAWRSLFTTRVKQRGLKNKKQAKTTPRSKGKKTLSK